MGSRYSFARSPVCNRCGTTAPVSIHWPPFAAAEDYVHLCACCMDLEITREAEHAAKGGDVGGGARR